MESYLLLHEEEKHERPCFFWEKDNSQVTQHVTRALDILLVLLNSHVVLLNSHVVLQHALVVAPDVFADGEGK